MGTKNESKTAVKGGKNASGSLKSLIGDLKVEITVRGYKSSEGDKTFEQPYPDKRQS